MDSRRPVYLKLYETLRQEILQGIWQYDDRLPSRRQLATDYGVSEITVDHCYELLCQEGYVQSKPRSGFFVMFQKEDGFLTPSPLFSDFTSVSGNSRLPFSPDDDLSTDPLSRLRTKPVSASEQKYPNNGSAESLLPSFPFSVIAKTMRRVLAEYREKILKKPPNAGCPELRTAISQYLARNRGLTILPEQIIVGSGAEYLYGMVTEILGREKTYGIESPSYERIEQVYRARGVSCELLPLGPDGIRSDVLRHTSADVLHITPYRSFPSGVTASASKRAEYLRWSAFGDRYIVEDDVESEFSLLRKTEETVFAHATMKNVIYMNTFSRTISPSFRIGYMVLPQKLLSVFERKVGFYSCTVPAFEQYVITELINKGDFERHINRIRRFERRQ